MYTDPPGIYFTVDGQNFLDSADFPWPAGSKHIVTSYDQDQFKTGTSYVYQGWATNLTGAAPSKAEPITADPSLKWVKLVFQTSRLLLVLLPDCPAPPQPCVKPGRVVVNGQTYDQRTQFYIADGSTVGARALPNDGFVFMGWQQNIGVLGRPTAFDISFTMDQPITLAPLFLPAGSVQAQVNIQTDPPQFEILLDRSPFKGPVSLQWGWGTVHTLGVNPAQFVNSTWWVFDSWSDGGAANHDITVPSVSNLNITARFVPGVGASFTTSPAGLSLSVDGSTKWPNYDFVWAPGSTHQISAPATQTDAQGRKYRFVSWSNGKPASFSYVAPTVADPRMTATYQAVGQATLTSNPVGMPLEVDGSACATPCTVERDAGTKVNLSAPIGRNIDDWSRLVFQGWNDAPDAARSITITGGSATYTAVYGTQNRLSVTATPREGATIAISPASNDGFYDSGAVVTVGVKLALGFRISGSSGDFSIGAAGAAVAMNSPKSAVLLLDRVPAVSPGGVRNAAAGASADSIAPGSLISIFGASLASDVQVGPPSPLVQTMLGVTVRADDSFMPLVFVSPGQINAQLPSTLSVGDHRLTVRWEGKPETSVKIAVARNAPGLFNYGSADQPVGSFVGADGQAVSADNPARAGDIVGALGTGFGPYVLTPPDGYLVDENGGYVVADTLTVIVGDGAQTNALYAGRSGVAVGVDTVRFQVPANLPDAAFLPVKVVVNGKESNTVLLPITK